MSEETPTKTRAKRFSAFGPGMVASGQRPQAKETAAELEAKKLAANNLKAAARTYTGEALETLVEVMRNRGANPQTRVAAANAILERGHGKSVNQTEISVGIYDRMSNADLIKFITGEAVIEGEVLAPKENPPELEYGGDDGEDD